MKKLINGKIKYKTHPCQQFKDDKTQIQIITVTPMYALKAKTLLELETKYNNNKNKTK